MTISGVRVQSGNGKESGKPYSMVRALVLNPLQEGQFGGMSVVGGGFEQSELETTAEIVDKLRAQKFPVVCEVELTPRNFAGKTAFVLTAVKPV
jgi:hypothetical protein